MAYTGPFPYTNNGTTTSIVVDNTSFSGDLINDGQITPGGITVTNSTIAGEISDVGAGYIAGGISLDANSVVGGGGNFGVFVENVAQFGSSPAAGGITNNGTISVNAVGIDVFGVSTFFGGITNTGTISLAGPGDGILVRSVFSFTGGIGNGGMIVAPSGQGIGLGSGSGNPAFTDPVLAFSGNVSNSGQITAQTGIAISNVAALNGNISVSGSIIASVSGISVSRSTIHGAIIDSGFLSGPNGAIMIDSHSSVIAPTGPAISLSGATISGSIFNFGTISGGLSLANVAACGNIVNAATIVGGISLDHVSNFSGEVSNGDTITAAASRTGIFVSASTPAGGIENSGTISAGTGILVTEPASISGVTVTDFGAITGSGGNAIDFMPHAGALDTLILGQGYSISGKVIGAGNDVLQLGSKPFSAANGAFNLNSIGPQYTGFTSYQVVGATWVLSGTGNENWSILAGTLELGSGATITQNVQLAGNPGHAATLRLDSGPSQIAGQITGAQLGDHFDLAYLPFAQGDRTNWQQNGSTGVLSVTDSNGVTLTSLTLTGTYSPGNFSAPHNDGTGGTQIDMQNVAPPAGTTADMIMSNSSTGDYEIYDIGNNSVLAAYPLTNIAAAWQVIGLGGFNGSDTTDMMLRNTSNGTGNYEIVDVSNNNASGPFQLGAVGLRLSVVGFGDFSGRPGETDMLLRDSHDGSFVVYDISNNMVTSATSLGPVGLVVEVLGFGDFSGKANETDMLMRDTRNGALVLYDISNNQVTSATTLGPVGSRWQFAGVGDFSGRPGETDMIMRDTSNGAFEIYDFVGGTITSATAVGAVGLSWTVAGFGDLSGNANETDMIMRTDTGGFMVYDFSNNQVTSTHPIGAVGLSYQVVGVANDPPSSGAPSSGATIASDQAQTSLTAPAASDPASADGWLSQMMQTQQSDPAGWLTQVMQAGASSVSGPAFDAGSDLMAGTMPSPPLATPNLLPTHSA